MTKAQLEDLLAVLEQALRDRKTVYYEFVTNSKKEKLYTEDIDTAIVFVTEALNAEESDDAPRT